MARLKVSELKERREQAKLPVPVLNTVDLDPETKALYKRWQRVSLDRLEAIESLRMVLDDYKQIRVQALKSKDKDADNVFFSSLKAILVAGTQLGNSIDSAVKSQFHTPFSMGGDDTNFLILTEDDNE